MANELPWNVTPHSDNRMNKMTNIPNTGAILATLDKTKHGLLICTATGGGLIVNHLYLCSADGESLIDITNMASHAHTGSTDGGDWLDIAISNPEVVDLWITKPSDFVSDTASGWLHTTTGSGSVSYTSDGSLLKYIRLLTGATSGSGSTVRYPYPLNLSFALNSATTFSTLFDTADSLAFHAGVNADDITAADSNTVKYNAEVCTATNNNWFIRSANGSANSTSDTGTAISASRIGVYMVHHPTLGTPEVTISINAGSLFQKTTHIPTGSSSTTNNLIKFSQKNNTAAERPCRFYGARITYVTSSSWGYNAFI